MAESRPVGDPTSGGECVCRRITASYTISLNIYKYQIFLLSFNFDVFLENLIYLLLLLCILVYKM